MVCVYLWQCSSHDAFFSYMRVCNFIPFFPPLPLVWWLCVRSRLRCCRGRRAVFSHTPSSTRTTRAARTSWTNSSMEANSSSLFFWTPWVNHTSAQHPRCLEHSQKPFNWWCKLKFKRGTGQWLVGESRRRCLHRARSFSSAVKAPVTGAKTALRIPSVCQRVWFEVV